MGNRTADTTVAISTPSLLGRIAGGLGRIRRADSVRRLHRHKTAVVGEILLLVIIASAVFAPLLAPYPIDAIDAKARLLGPTWSHLFGTDNLGRDMLSRTLYGGRISLQVGLMAVATGLFAGVALGLISGYKGGTGLDQAIMAVMDALRAFPPLILVLGLVVALGPNLTNIMIAIGITGLPEFARLTRGQVLSVRENEYVTAARALGAGTNRIIVRHLFPNIVAPIIVLSVVRLSASIMVEASLSFLGLGVQPPIPSWGSMVRAGYSFLDAAPGFALIPAIAIFLTVLATLLLGNGLRDALDPKRRGR